MKFSSYFQSFGFTRNETKVILLLSSTFLLGLAIRYYNSSTQPAKPPDKEFDYSLTDSIFQARSEPHTLSSRNASLTDDSSTADSSSIPYARKKTSAPVNINIATRDDLIQLPGIGPAYAERIITYRTENGPFKSADDLENVKGIGKKRLERLRPFVRVR